MARKFYVFGHNPNSIEETIACLRAGANAIEPDLCFHDDNFFVHEQIPYLPKFLSRWLFKGPALTEYLTALKDHLGANPATNLAMLAFDLKEPYDYDINRLFGIFRRLFTEFFPGVAILTTVSSDEGMRFTAQLQQRRNEAVGVDEHLQPEEVDRFYAQTGLRYTYGNGSSFCLDRVTRYTGEIRRARDLRNAGSSFRLVYPWTVNSESAMRRFLDMDIDGMVTDKIERLLALLRNEYADKYDLATKDDEPFG